MGGSSRSERRRWSVVFVALAALALTGCLCPPQPGLAPDAFEPNDTRPQAAVLAVGTPVVATMNEFEEPDVFRFEAEEGQTVRVEVDRLEGSLLDLDALLEGPGGDSVTAMMPEQRDAYPASFDYQVVETGTHYLELTHRYTGPPDAQCAKGVLRYELNVSVVSEAAEGDADAPASPAVARAGVLVPSAAGLAGRDPTQTRVTCTA